MAVLTAPPPASGNTPPSTGGLVPLLVRLRWTVQRHTVGWKRATGLVLGVLGALLTWAATVAAAPEARGDVLRLLLVLWLVGWVIGPVLTSGAAVLRPEWFALLPLRRDRLGTSLLASVFAGVGAAVTAGAVLAVVGYALVAAPDPGVAAVAAVVGLVGAVLLLVLVVALSRALYQLVGAAMRTGVGVEIAAIQYGLVISALFAGWLAVQPVVGSVPVLLGSGLDAVPGAAGILAWLPSSWPVLAVDAVLAGRAGLALAHLGGLAVAAVLAVAAAVRLLTPHVGNRTARRSRRPRGSAVLTRPRILPATPLGAVLGKELRIWWRDPWRSLEIRTGVWTALFLVAYVTIAGLGQLSVFAGSVVALMIALSGANLYGYDGTALWQLVVGQSRAAVSADVRGRQLALLVVFGGPAIALTAVFVLISGGWGLLLPALATLLAVTGVGTGVAVALSVLGVTPGVDPHRRVNSADAGSNGLVVQVALYLTLVLSAPTVVAVVPLAAGVLPGWSAPLVVVLAAVNGAGVAWWGGRIARDRLSARLPETFTRLRYPGTRVRTGGGDLLDRFATAAQDTAIKERAQQGAQADG